MNSICDQGLSGQAMPKATQITTDPPADNHRANDPPADDHRANDPPANDDKDETTEINNWEIWEKLVKRQGSVKHIKFPLIFTTFS